MTPQQLERCEKYNKHFCELLEVTCKIINISDEKATMQNPCENFDFCRGCIYEKKDEFATRFYGCNEAHRWNGKYIYYCPIGLVFIATSVDDKVGDLSGGIVLGPIVMGDYQDVISDLPTPEMAKQIETLKSYSTQDVQHISELLSGITQGISGIEGNEHPELLYDQEKVLNEIYKAKDIYDSSDSQSADSLLKFEKDLRAAVITGEKDTAMQLLNEVLAHVYVYSNFDVNAIKARMLELLVMLSRATIEAGADTSEIFKLSQNYIQEIEKYTDIDQLAFWISDIVRRFIMQAFDLAHVKHSDVIFKITNYIKKNSSEKITLDSLARHVYLSKSYLSSIFKQETGMSLTAYITKVRIEKSKKMLMEDCVSLSVIATQCGFKDQSYFTKVFKKETGVSPKKYRNNFFNVE